MKMTGSVGYAPNPRGRRRGWDSIYETDPSLIPEPSLQSYFSSLEKSEQESVEQTAATATDVNEATNPDTLQADPIVSNSEVVVDEQQQVSTS